jgi:hypothetical protein
MRWTYYKGNNIGVHDAMLALVDIFIGQFLHDIDDHIAISYACFSSPCDTCDTTIVKHVRLDACENMTMPSYENFNFSTVVDSNMLNDFLTIGLSTTIIKL